jgi:FixJ family two-component response regulator
MGARVFLVDDDPAVLKALSRLLRSAGYDPQAFKSAADFMTTYHPDSPGCLVLDLSMPELTGLDLQHWLAQTKSPLPVIFLSGRGDVPTSVKAMKDGALDFLTKPVDEKALLRTVESALQRDTEVRGKRAEETALLTRLGSLTPREREVMEGVVLGKLNKQIAAELGTVEKTVKVHRARVMQKMGAESVAELVRMAERVGISLSPPPSPPGGDTAQPARP